MPRTKSTATPNENSQLVKIDKNIPIPPPRQTIEWNRLPFEDLKEKESFLVPFVLFKNKDTSISQVRNKIQTVVKLKCNTFKPKVFVTRTEKDGIRVWRIS